MPYHSLGIVPRVIAAGPVGVPAAAGARGTHGPAARRGAGAGGDGAVCPGAHVARGRARVTA